VQNKLLLYHQVLYQKSKTTYKADEPKQLRNQTVDGMGKLPL